VNFIFSIYYNKFIVAIFFSLSFLSPLTINNNMFRCGKCPSTFNFKSSLVDHEKIHNEESKKIEIGPQMFVPNIPAGPSNSLLNDLSPRGNTTDTYMAATEEFENTNTIRG